MRRFVSRRDFLFESCGGISGLGLAWLLNAGQSARERLRHGAAGAMPAKKPHFARAGEERHLAVHERRRQPRRHLRSQACA